MLVAEVVVSGLATPARPAHAAAGRARPRPRDRPLRGRRGGPGPAQRQPRAQPRHRLPARLVRLDGAGRRAADDEGAPGAVARRLHRQRRPVLAQPQPAALARRPLGHRPRRRRSTSTTAGAAGVTDPARFAAQPWDVGDHVLRARARGLRARARRARSRRGSTATSSPRCWPRCPTRGWSRCPAPRRRTRCARRTSTSSPPASAPASGCPEASRMSADPAGLPVRRAALRAARGPRGVPQRRRGALLPGRRLPRRGLARRRRAAARARPAASTSTRSARRWPSSTGCARGDERGGRGGAAAARHSGSASSRRRAAPCSSPARCTAGVTDDPARQLEHLRERLVG